jgi:hypothetical protein
MAPAARKFLGKAFARVGAVAFGRKRGPDFEVVTLAPARPEDCFEVYRDALDDLVESGLVDPANDSVVWLGVLDVIPSDFAKLQ